jgi:hypothetical protein
MCTSSTKRSDYIGFFSLLRELYSWCSLTEKKGVSGSVNVKKQKKKRRREHLIQELDTHQPHNKARKNVTRPKHFVTNSTDLV